MAGVGCLGGATPMSECGHDEAVGWMSGAAVGAPTGLLCRGVAGALLWRPAYDALCSTMVTGRVACAVLTVHVAG